MTVKIANHIVQTQNSHECTALDHRSRFVNMRLFKENEGYKKIILSVIEYMKDHLGTTFEDYQNLRGVSAVKLGIPWNIIAYKDQSNVIRVCINPQIVKYSPTKIEIDYKCPSMILKTPIKTFRYNTIDLQFFDLNGIQVVYSGITKPDGGYIIQHELEHCSGVHFPIQGETPAK